jgi:hypothetical protein
MTMQTLDSATAHNVTGAVVRQQIQVSTGTPLKALPGLLARQRAAFLRDGPPSLVERRANLKKLRAALLARRGDRIRNYGRGGALRCRWNSRRKPMTPADIAPPAPSEPVTRMSGTMRFVPFASSEMTLTNAVASAPSASF